MYDVLDDFVCDLTCEEYYSDGWNVEETWPLEDDYDRGSRDHDSNSWCNY